MTPVEQELRAKVSEMLTSGEIACFIGYASGRDPATAGPVFVRRPADVDRLVWNPFCRSSLAKYLLDFRGVDGKVGIAVKGCDSKSVVRLINDNQLQRGKVVVFGLPCPGILKESGAPELPRGTQTEWEQTPEGFRLRWATGSASLARQESLESRCLACATPVSVVADVTIGVAGDPVPVDRAALFGDVAAVENLSSEQKREFWRGQFSKCLRCYACRNSCPACSCRECCFDAADTKWLGKGTSVDENEVFQLTRAFHVAGRCTGCGECDRACPVGIPLSLLNKKVAKDMAELFGTTAPGSDLEEETPFKTFSMEDPEEFM